MTMRTVPVCGEHLEKKEWKPTTFEYFEEGLSIRVPRIYAWVCPAVGEASFTAETVDEIIVTVRELLEKRETCSPATVNANGIHCLSG